MKLFALFMFLGFCTCHATVRAQDARIDLKMSDATLSQVFQKIEQLTEYMFIYKSEDIQAIEHVTVDVSQMMVKDVLETCLKGTELSYIFKNNVIVIQKLPREEKEKGFRVVGRVTDEKKQSMPGVTVRLDGTTIGSATNNEGIFALTLPIRKGVLIISFVGYKTQKVNFAETMKDTLIVVMYEDVQALDETVVVAYGNTTKREMTGAVSVIKAEELKGIPATDIATLLQGRVAGMDVTQMSGAPGGGGTAITIRGYNSLDVEQGRRFSNPLWVVDGVPLNTFSSPVTGTNLLADINPDMIESIQILKDASSAAIYGSRAANGVIIVTTKKGRKDQNATFSANVSQSWGIVPELPAITVGKAERDLRFETITGTQGAYLDSKTKRYIYPTSNEEVFWYGRKGSYDYFFSPTVLGSPDPIFYQDSLNSFYNNATNFFPAYFRTGKVTNANIQTYGGTERMGYGIGLGYYNESGVFVGTGFNRIDLNSSMTVIPVNRLTVDLRFNASLTNRKRGEKVDGFAQAPMVEQVPGDPFWLSSLYPGEGSESWEASLQKLRGTKEKNRSVRLRSNFKLGYDVFEGLNISTSLAADYSIHRRNYFQPSYLSGRGYSKSIGETSINLMVLNENLVSYKKTWKENHTINFLAGFSYQYDQAEYNGGSAENSPSDKIYYAPQGMPELGQGERWDGEMATIALQHYQSDMQEKTLISYFGRLEYNYRQKYLFSVSFRRDGSSVFGRNNKWGAFPAVAGGWTFSEENLLKERMPWLSFGKIRASWGRSGRHFEEAYLALGLMTLGEYSHQGNATLAPNWNGGLYNDELSWEETDQYDFGLDLDLFDYRLGMTLDYYYRYTDKLLYPVALPGNYNGFDKQWRNAAAVSNEGIELMIKYEIFRRPDLYWKVSVNGAKNWNRIEKSYNGKDLDFGITGEPLNRVQVYKTNGWVKRQEDLPLFYNASGESYYLTSSVYQINKYFRPGDPFYADINGDGCIDARDMVYGGSTLPVVSGGIVSEFRWKNFDLNFSMHYSIGRHMINNIGTFSMTFTTDPTSKYYSHPVLINLDKAKIWRNPEDEGADYSRLQMLGGAGEIDPQVKNLDRDVEKVNYLKLKTLTIGYNLPKSIIDRFRMQQLRVFVSGENLWTWTNYSGIDPEVVDITTGIDKGTGYPLSRKFTIGLTVKF